MSDAPRAVDEFSAAKASLRDTIKWLAAILSTLAAALVTGSSIKGLTAPPGWRLWIALAGAGCGLIAIFIAVGILLDLLLTKTLFLDEVRRDPTLSSWLDRHKRDVLPADCPDLAAFFQERDDTIATLQKLRFEKADAKYIEALNTFLLEGPTCERIMGLASFELLRRRVVRRLYWIFGLAFVTIIGLGLFAVYGGATSDRPRNDVQIQFELSPAKLR